MSRNSSLLIKSTSQWLKYDHFLTSAFSFHLPFDTQDSAIKLYLPSLCRWLRQQKFTISQLLGLEKPRPRFISNGHTAIPGCTLTSCAGGNGEMGFLDPCLTILHFTMNKSLFFAVFHMRLFSKCSHIVHFNCTTGQSTEPQRLESYQSKIEMFTVLLGIFLHILVL